MSLAEADQILSSKCFTSLPSCFANLGLMLPIFDQTSEYQGKAMLYLHAYIALHERIGSLSVQKIYLTWVGLSSIPDL